MESVNTITSAGPETLATLKRMALDISQLKISPDQIGDNANLFNDCGLDSTSVVELVIALEQEFDIVIAEDELDVRLFQDMSSLGAFVESKRAEVFA
jgi:acyl carrier protein